MSKQMNYAIEPDLEPAGHIDVLRRSTLAGRRPVEDADRIAKMLTGANVIMTTRDDDGTLVGVARAITDFAYCTYLSDLAVDVASQGTGIGRELIRLVDEKAGLDTRLILLSAPAAQSYYPHIGMEKHESCWMIPPRDVP